MSFSKLLSPFTLNIFQEEKMSVRKFDYLLILCFGFLLFNLIFFLWKVITSDSWEQTIFIVPFLISAYIIHIYIKFIKWYVKIPPDIFSKLQNICYNIIATQTIFNDERKENFRLFMKELSMDPKEFRKKHC